ncbi:MAG TPA: hydantoinase/oxoprolinase family protein [Rhodopila sp.]|uniref:hydantoinase/oxoprolinase family protein n=1 Tax=Rhodopila sp. TaxID=2480087 RepID=UPI002C952CB9|nr:hydantoinase/oxoprolinase family protein [Rhodopila sp.]HVY13618.1 hydantoinase/oxoprolinase family protein [Rhodopila sp.]
MMRVGVEVGGTFTDMVAIEGKTLRIVKVPSTPHSPDIGAFASLEAARVPLPAVSDLVHGSTVATNAILERRGAAIAFVTTRGFRDILFLQRQDRRQIYDLHYAKPAPPLRRRDCFEVTERIDAAGQVVTPLDEAAVVREILPALAAGGYTAVAICLLSAYASPVHEARLRALVEAALPGLRVTCSHDVACEFREFERASTTTLSAYVQPVIDTYIDRFETVLAAAGFRGSFSIMQSNGGRIPALGMRRSAITALFSGPAAGVIGAVRQAQRSGVGNVITFDMGGTSTDVSLVTAGQASLTPETEINGLPVRTPVLDIVSVGAGGGSLVWIDDGGMLRVGPRSAGADPGPACYGRGGTLPTITDAHVVRGTIRPDGFLGGTMQLDRDAAHRAFAEVAARLGMPIAAAAAAAIRLAVANIVRAIQVVSTERGRDPREYALLPFGGGGPLLAAEIAEELALREILIPPNPGVVSALGLVSADYVKVYGATRRMRLDTAVPDALREAYAGFFRQAEDEFRSHGLHEPLECALEADMRYVGQAFEIPVPVEAGALKTLSVADLAERFTEVHRRVYLHGGEPGRMVELVGLRFSARQKLPSLPTVQEWEVTGDRPACSLVTMATGDVVESRLLAATARTLDAPVTGPAMIEGYSSTVWVPPGWSAERDAANNIRMKRTG